MLDTFAKRLAAEGRTSPGDISTDDRWAIGGTFRPTLWRDGKTLVALGAIAAHFVGTFTAGAPPSYSGKVIPALGAIAPSARGSTTSPGTAQLSIDDRYHVEGRQYPPSFFSINDRFALGGSYRRISADTPPGGKIGAQLGSLVSGLVGDHTAAIFFDVAYSITPAVAFTVMPGVNGAIARALGALVSSLRGTSLPPNSSSGLVQALEGNLSASFRGTMVAPASRDGRLHCDTSSVAARLLGSSVPPQGVIGQLLAVSSALQPALRGSFTPWSTGGKMAPSLGALRGQLFGQPLRPGDIYGFVQATLAGAQAQLVGESEVQVGGLEAEEITVEPALGADAVALESELDGQIELEPLT